MRLGCLGYSQKEIFVQDSDPAEASCVNKGNVDEQGYFNGNKCDSIPLHDKVKGPGIKEGSSGRKVSSFEYFHCEVCRYHVPASRDAFTLEDLGKKTSWKKCGKSRDTRNGYASAVLFGISVIGINCRPNK